MLKQYAEKLIAFGLTEKEAKVYLTLLDIGNGTADQIAKLTQLNRSTTYVQIKNLTELGLVSTFKRAKKTFFAAEAPNNIERILDRKSSQLKHQYSEAGQLVPELMKIYSTTGARPIVRIFEGKEGLTSMRNGILNSKETELLIVFSIDNMLKIFSEKELMDFSNERSKKGINSTVIYTKDGKDIPLVEPQQLKRIDKSSYPFDSDIYIYGDTVSFATTENQIMGLTITNEAVATSMRTIFKVAWEGLPDK